MAAPSEVERIVMRPPDNYPDQATVDAAVEAFLTNSPAGAVDEFGRSGLQRDIAAALRVAYGREVAQGPGTVE